MYDLDVGGLLLVTQFLLGLKNELRAAVEVQVPNSISEAASFAQSSAGRSFGERQALHEQEGQ